MPPVFKNHNNDKGFKGVLPYCSHMCAAVLENHTVQQYRRSLHEYANYIKFGQKFLSFCGCVFSYCIKTLVLLFKTLTTVMVLGRLPLLWS